MALTISQQHLLNYFKLIHVSSYENAVKVFEQIREKLDQNQRDNTRTLSEEIGVVNKKLKEFDLEIVQSIDEFTSEKLFILINTSPDNIFQQTKFYDKNSINLLSEVIRECILSPKGNINETCCLNLSSQIGISKTDIQSILQNLVKEKWLVSREGIISLGMRTIVELEQNLKEAYQDDIQNCPLCKLICIQGFTCDKCYSKYHHGCIKKYVAASSKSHPRCHTCREELENLELIVNFERVSIDVDQNSVDDSVRPKRRKKIE